MASDKIYIQYGCGFNAPETWCNFDASPTLRLEQIPLLGLLVRKNSQRFPSNVKYGDIAKGLPVPLASCSGVYASHVLEHLSYEDFRIALLNTFAILKPAGIFRIVLPDLEIAAKRYVTSKDSNAAEQFLHETSLGLKKRSKGVAGLLRVWLGNSSHLWMWDYKGLVHELEQTGFSQIRRCVYGDCVDKSFLDVEDRVRFTDSVAVECRRPELT
jgi:hypothetical protein